LLYTSKTSILEQISLTFPTNVGISSDKICED